MIVSLYQVGELPRKFSVNACDSVFVMFAPGQLSRLP
jgi:hypothetical protein